MDVMHCAQCQQQGFPEDVICSQCGESPLLDGRYRLLRELGRGAFGTTWLAERAADGARVAVKEMLVRKLDTFKTYDLFNREAELLQTLQHEAIPRYFEHFQVGQGRQLGLYLVTAFVDGETLEAVMKRQRFGVPEALAVLRELLEVVGWLHALSPPVVHRDIKPANVMRRRSDGRLVLIDFGAVKEAARDSEAGGSTVAGTFGYMPPEQFAGRASPASDVYALGVLTLELVTREAPQAFLDDRNTLQWQSSVTHDGLRQLLMGLLEPDVRKRPSDARSLIAQVDALLAGRPLAGSAASRLAVHAPAAPTPAAHQDPRVATFLRNNPNIGALGSPGGAPGLLAELGPLMTPGVAPEPPPVPRAAPPGFGKRHDPTGYLLSWFGGLFALGPLLFTPLMMQMSPGVGLGLVAILPLIFLGAGGLGLTLGLTRIARRKRLWRLGQATPAVVTHVDHDTSLRVNGRSPFRLTYHYPTPDGGVAQGTAVSFDIPPAMRLPGAQVWALLDPADPHKSLASWD